MQFARRCSETQYTRCDFGESFWIKLVVRETNVEYIRKFNGKLIWKIPSLQNSFLQKFISFKYKWTYFHISTHVGNFLRTSCHNTCRISLWHDIWSKHQSPFDLLDKCSVSMVATRLPRWVWPQTQISGAVWPLVKKLSCICCLQISKQTMEHLKGRKFDGILVWRIAIFYVDFKRSFP